MAENWATGNIASARQQCKVAGASGLPSLGWIESRRRLFSMSKVFLTVSEGETATTAKPVIVTSDADAIAAVGRALARRLGAELPQVLKPRPEKPTGDGA